MTAQLRMLLGLAAGRRRRRGTIAGDGPPDADPRIGPPAVLVERLTKRYPRGLGYGTGSPDAGPALDGVSFAVQQGELFALLGPNGAGKTTTIRILTTLLIPTSGVARVLGFDVALEPQRVRPHIGFVFGGDRGLYTRLTGRDNLRYFAELYAIPPRMVRDRIAFLISLVGLDGREHEKVERYSRGMRQRLHIARALIHDPEVLFLDEPTIGLDPVGARDLRTLVRTMAQRGKTIFLTTHYLFEAEAICDRVAVLKHGRIVAEGDPSSVRLAGAGASVVEFVVDGASQEQIGRLRALPGVSTVLTSTVELNQVICVHCVKTDGIIQSVREIMAGLAIRDLRARASTLEDAYVRLVAD
jgi:ABC-2 type transport system ATP-binding protein